MRRIAPLVLLIAAVPIGCNDANHPPTHRATGAVTVGGQPATGAVVVLAPTAPFDPDADNPRAVVEDDGSFAISTYGEGDGAPTGEYKLLVLPPSSPEEGGLSAPEPVDEQQMQAYEPYRSPGTTPMTVTIQEGPNDLGRIEL